MRFLLVCLLLLASLAGLAQNTPPTVSLSLSQKAVKPGEPVKGTVSVTFAPGLHGYQNPPTQDYMIPVRVESASKDVKLAKVNYPPGQVKEAGGEEAAVYDGTIQIPVTLEVPKKPGPLKITLKVHYQQCTDVTCFPPSSVEATANITVQAPTKPPVESPAPPAAQTDPQTTKGQDDPEKQTTTAAQPEPRKDTKAPVLEPDAPPVADPNSPAVRSVKDAIVVPGPVDEAGNVAKPSSQRPAQPEAQEEEGGLAGFVKSAFASKNYLLLFVLLFVVGLAINLTPCVYPLVPVTISFFSTQAGENKGIRMQLGLMYVVGIAVMYGLVGGIAASLGGAFGELFTRPWFLVFLGLLMIGLSLAMFDLYELRIPPALSKHLRGRSGPVGALIMGLLVGVAAAPCAGPVIVALFTEAAKLNNATLSVLFFTTVGLGIGVPYLILGLATAGTKSLPKAGAWMKTVKALLGLLVLGIGLNYLLQAAVGLSDAEKLLAWVVFYLASAVYLFAFDRSDATRFIVGLKGAAILALGMMAGISFSERNDILKTERIQALGGAVGATKIDWKPFTLDAFEQAKLSGKVIVVDGTADWCAECHKIDRQVFQQPEAIVAMRDVVALKVDWSTGVDPKYVEMTRKLFDIEGLPHIVFHRPGGERSEIKLHLESPRELIESLRKAGAPL